MERQLASDPFEKARKELEKSISRVMNHLQQGIQEYLTNSIDISSLLEVVEKLGLSNIIEMTIKPMPGFDYYKVLGLDKTANNFEVKERYREIMSKIHPDVSGKEMTFLTTLVNIAYDIIKKERGI